MIGWLVGMMAIAGAASANAPLSEAAPALQDFASYCGRGQAIWHKTLCGPIIIVDSDSRQAIANSDPKLPGFKKDGLFWSGTLPKDEKIANTSVTLPGGRFAEIMAPLPADAGERRILLTHESFHRIQPALGFEGHEADNAHLDSKEGRIFARLEMAALKAALTNKNWRIAAQDALAYRAARLTVFPGAAAAESSLIANEGVAEYTGIKVGAGASAQRYAIDRLDKGPSRPSLIRSFGYVVGPAYGLLLDRTGRPWQEAALKGTPLPQMLADAIGAKPEKADLSRYGGPAIVAEETARDEYIQQRRTALNAELVNGPTVTFPFGGNIVFDPNTLFSLGSKGTVYSRATTLTGEWGMLKVTGDVLISSDWTSIRVPAPVTLSGTTAKGPGWNAEIKEPFTLAPGDRPGSFVVKKKERP